MPSRFDAAVIATSRVRGESTAATSSSVSSADAGSNSAQRTVAPTAAAATIQGRMFASWSRRVTTTSSPGSHVAASVRAMANVSSVMLRPNTTPRASAPSRSATAARASWTMPSAVRSASVTVPRLASGLRRVRATASATESGTCDPPGPSKCAKPAFRAGKRSRTAATS